MTRLTSVGPRFVELIPRDLDPGVVYVSLEYTTVAHLCCCGCGKRVVLPLSPAQWEVTFDGETVSLWPSVGSWDLDCRSHYVIDRNEIRWSKQWTDERVAAARRADARAVARHVGANDAEPGNAPLPTGLLQKAVSVARSMRGRLRWVARRRRPGR